ncbi:hypothetical protein V1290_003785 [Bradyrhizobium sp. AZCC 1578]|uniref:hypothetical protein n=1 Tax=Bradyrhizobium sp. AZCC 1578 TaxID=3117027 RepID=UPI002FF3AFD2
MTRRPELPSDEFLLAYLRESMRLYNEALLTATDTQKLVWRYCNRTKFVEDAFPYYEGDVKVTCLISNAMGYCIDALMPVEQALAAAKQWLAKHWRPPSKRYQRYLDSRLRDTR